MIQYGPVGTRPYPGQTIPSPGKIRRTPRQTKLKTDINIYKFYLDIYYNAATCNIIRLLERQIRTPSDTTVKYGKWDSEPSNTTNM
jgi:hypothetical protein